MTSDVIKCRDDLVCTLIRRVWTIGIGRPGRVYSETCEAFVHGRKAILYSLTAHGFYEVMVMKGREIMEMLDVTALEAWLSDSHLRLARMKLKSIESQISLSIIGREMIDGEAKNLLQISVPSMAERLLANKSVNETQDFVKRAIT